MAFQVEGLVMTDMQQYYTDNSREKPSFLDGSDLRKWISDCTCGVCRKTSVKLETGTQSLVEQYRMTTRVSNPRLTDHHYLLCPFEIPAFVFKTRTWGENLHQPKAMAVY